MTTKKKNCGYSQLPTGTLQCLFPFDVISYYCPFFFFLPWTHWVSGLPLSHQIHSSSRHLYLLFQFLEQSSLDDQHGCSLISFRSLFKFHLQRDAFPDHPFPALLSLLLCLYIGYYYHLTLCIYLLSMCLPS